MRKEKPTLEDFERESKEFFLKIGKNLEKLKKRDPKTYKEFMEFVY